MKNSIFTITPNPSLDMSGFVERIKLDEKSYVQKEARAPGGNAINVARILRRLDATVVASGFLGGSIGDEVAKLLEAEGVKHDFVRIKDSTRINITISNLRDHRQTRLSFSGPKIRRAEFHDLLELIRARQGGVLVVGGSLPPQFSVRDLDKLIRVAQNKSMSVVVDCPGSVLKQLSAEKLLLIKPNLDEFQALTGSRVRSISAVRRQALALRKMATYICVSSVEGGALLVSESGCCFGRIPPVKIKSTVGAGDSMVGAMVAQIHHGNQSMEDILRWGLAAAAATLTETGTKLGPASSIKKLYKKTVVTVL